MLLHLLINAYIDTKNIKMTNLQSSLRNFMRNCSIFRSFSMIFRKMYKCTNKKSSVATVFHFNVPKIFSPRIVDSSSVKVSNDPNSRFSFKLSNWTRVVLSVVSRIEAVILICIPWTNEQSHAAIYYHVLRIIW